MKCLPRAQATGGVAFTNDGSTSCRCDPIVCDPIVCEARRSLSGLRIGAAALAVEQCSRNSSLQREMHNGELGRCSPGCCEKT